MIESSVGSIVGFVALFVQVYFNRKQKVAAQDKLKFDLFEKRYGIYLAASALIESSIRVKRHRARKRSFMSYRLSWSRLSLSSMIRRAISLHRSSRDRAGFSSF
jgi:hypothetical protein